MYNPQQKAKAVEVYDSLGHIGATVRRLGYPTPTCTTITRSVSRSRWAG